MSLKNQCRTYEIKKGESEALAEKWTERLSREMGEEKKISYDKVKENYKEIIEDFKNIPREEKRAPKVGVVGEIFVKYSPLGNNNLEDFLVSEGAEVVVPGLFDFCLYCLYNYILDTELYGLSKLKYPLFKMAYKFALKKQQDIIDIINEDGSFDPPTIFSHTVSLVEGYLGLGAKMGEGWLLTAEMLELAEKGVPNIVCTQPFGCLPNHICGKGMIKPIKEKNPDINIVPIDYDAGATAVNQENRIKLMLANSK
jgi:predicted nucleotide-binding protein (sugar kinase/HSP70/actin superfamily)